MWGGSKEESRLLFEVLYYCWEVSQYPSPPKSAPYLYYPQIGKTRFLFRGNLHWVTDQSWDLALLSPPPVFSKMLSKSVGCGLFVVSSFTVGSSWVLLTISCASYIYKRSRLKPGVARTVSKHEARVAWRENACNGICARRCTCHGEVELGSEDPVVTRTWRLCCVFVQPSPQPPVRHPDPSTTVLKVGEHDFEWISRDHCWKTTRDLPTLYGEAYFS